MKWLLIAVFKTATKATVTEKSSTVLKDEGSGMAGTGGRKSWKRL